MSDFEVMKNGNAWIGFSRQTIMDGRHTYTGVGNLTEGDYIELFTNFDPANFSIIGINVTRISDEDCEAAAL